MIPSTIHPSVKSSAEKKLFSLFRNAADTDDWICLHSLGFECHIAKRRGEIDFLLLTRKGIFVLEVKGGRVSRENGIWKYTDRFGVVHGKAESPFDQAGSAMFSLESKIKQHFQNDKRMSQLLYGFGVMFPDIMFDDTGIEASQLQVYDIRDRNQAIKCYVNRLASYWRDKYHQKRYAPTKKQIETIADYLRGDFDLIPPLHIQAEKIAEDILSLEQEQYTVLDTLDQLPNPRILVQGSAGTGKTLLAVEIAKREARKNNGKILLLCYNRLLANFLEKKIYNEQIYSERITVKSIYALIYDLVISSSFALEFKSRCQTSKDDSIYNEIYPHYALLALAETEIPPFGTIIVDEAQDMMTDDILDIIDFFIDGGLENGRWWFFCDINNQASIYGVLEEMSLKRLMHHGYLMPLIVNCRNTKPIANETSMLSQPKIQSVASTQGIPVKYSWYKNNNLQPQILQRVLEKLLSKNIEPHRITVLSPLKSEKCCAVSTISPKLIQLNKNNIWDISIGKNNVISYGTVSAFKGLENDFIVLTDINDLSSEWWRSVIYVGMTRARIGLHLLVNLSLKQLYEEKLRDWIYLHNKNDL